MFIGTTFSRTVDNVARCSVLVLSVEKKQGLRAGVEQIKLANHIDLRTTAALLSAQLAGPSMDGTPEGAPDFDGSAAARAPAADAVLDDPSNRARLLDLTLGRKLRELPEQLTDAVELHALPAVLPATQSIKVGFSSFCLCMSPLFPSLSLYDARFRSQLCVPG